MQKNNFLRKLALSLLILGLCTSPVHAATNPSGNTISGMPTTAGDNSYDNQGVISGGVLNSLGFYAGIGGYIVSNENFSFKNSNQISIIRPTNDLIIGILAYIPTLGKIDVINSGAITVHGAQTTVGIYAVTDNGYVSINNSGSITARGENDEAFGILVSTEVGANVVNSGNIEVIGVDVVHGISLAAEAYSEVINTGNIEVRGRDGVYGISAEISNDAKAVITNANFISSYASTGDAYGMNITSGSNNVIVNNTGIINSSAPNGRAFEVHGQTNYNVGTWATTLRTWSGNDAVFGITGVLNKLNFVNSTLILRPGSAAQDFALGKEYSVANMVSKDGAQQDSMSTSINGTIVAAVAEVPFLKATLTNGASPKDATVRLDSNVSDETTPGTATMQQAVAQVQNQFSNLSTSLRNALVQIYTEANLVADTTQDSVSGVAAGSSVVNNKWQIFLSPHASYVNNSKYDYDGSNMGVTAGASYRLSDSFSFGAHLDLSFGDYSGDFMNMNTDSTSFALGLHAAYNFSPAWYLRGQITGSINQNDSDFRSDLTSLHGNADFNGEALYAELATGYTWQIAKGHSITPEIGLSYLGTHTYAYDVDWNISNMALPLYNMSYDDSYYNAFYATAHVDWRGEWAVNDNSAIAFMAGLGLRQTLTNGKIDTSFKMLGSNYTATGTEDVTTFLVDAGVEYNWDIISISLNYEGGFGYDQTNHGGTLQLKFEF